MNFPIIVKSLVSTPPPTPDHFDMSSTTSLRSRRYAITDSSRAGNSIRVGYRKSKDTQEQLTTQVIVHEKPPNRYRALRVSIFEDGDNFKIVGQLYSLKLATTGVTAKAILGHTSALKKAYGDLFDHLGGNVTVTESGNGHVRIITVNLFATVGLSDSVTIRNAIMAHCTAAPFRYSSEFTTLNDIGALDDTYHLSDPMFKLNPSKRKR